MKKRVRRTRWLALLALWLIGAAHARVFAADDNDEARLAALALPGAAQADWRQWDSFLTNVVKKLGAEFQPALRDRLGETFLDSRYQLAGLLRSGSADPVPQLFTDAWQRLSPLIKQAIPAANQTNAAQYASFIRAMDAASSFSGIGQRLGIFRLTPDALRGAAQAIGAGGGDPLAYTTELDAGLRNLLGFTAALPDIRPSPFLEQGSLPRLLERARAALAPFPPAHAAQADFDRLNGWVPEQKDIQDYLVKIRELLTTLADRVLAKSKLAPEHARLYRQIIFATGWQESCWRQFIKKGEKLATLASSTGDVGLMQVNRITWRSVYDVKGLTGDIVYNGNAGAEILHYYLTRYAIPKKEDRQPRGHLARATYSAYNAGPGGLARYRGVRQSAVWKKVDEAFWSKFQSVSSGQELDVKRCYES